jgi:hypothetical protein
MKLPIAAAFSTNLLFAAAPQPVIALEQIDCRHKVHNGVVDGEWSRLISVRQSLLITHPNRPNILKDCALECDQNAWARVARVHLGNEFVLI